MTRDEASNLIMDIASGIFSLSSVTTDAGELRAYQRAHDVVAEVHRRLTLGIEAEASTLQ